VTKDKYNRAVMVMATLMGLSAILTIARLRQGTELVRWRTDYTAAQAESKTAGKPLFVYFTASWCGPCQSLKSTTWADRGVARALESKYIPVKLDVDDNPALAERYHTDGIPYFLVFDGAGNVVKTTTGALDASEFLEWLNAAPAPTSSVAATEPSP
jgi:thiol:disulfide interchange protein